MGQMKLALTLVLLIACGDNQDPAPPDAVFLLAPDAAPDACSREPSGDCCALLPDENAVRECAAATVNPGDCGVAVCWMADCSSVRLNFCAPT